MAIKSSRFLPALKRGVSKSATPGERVMGSLFPNSSYASNWSNNRYEQVQHFLDWQFIAINTIASKVASITPNIAYVGGAHKPGVTVKACQRALTGGMFGGSTEIDTSYQKSKHTPHTSRPLPISFGAGHGSTFMTVGEYKGKALSVIKPHEELEPLENDHLLRRLIDNPNPTDTQFDYVYEKVMFLYLCGTSYEWVIPNAWGRPCERWVIPSHWVWPRTGDGRLVDEENPDANKLIAYYEVRPWGGMGSAGMLRLPASEVVMTRFKSPVNKLDGYSRLWAVGRWIDTEESITKSRWAQFINKARPELWIELGPGYEDPDDNMIARLEGKIAQKHQGEMNTGKPLITPSGAKATVLSFSPNEMDYFQSEQQMAEMILSAFGVPKAAVGLVNDMTFGSILATLMNLCEGCLNPLLAMMGQSDTKQLASRWDEEGRRVKLWYDNCTPADPAQVNADIAVDLQGYAMTPNMLLALRGRQPYKRGGNNPLVSGPGGIMPLPINEEETDELTDVVRQYSEAMAADKDAAKLGTQLSNEDVPKDEVNEDSSGERNEGQPNPAEEEVEQNDGGKIEEPNGKPSKKGYKHARKSTNGKRMGGDGRVRGSSGGADRRGGAAQSKVIFQKWCRAWVKKDDGPHEFSSTQFNIEAAALEHVRTLQDQILDADLAAKGKESIPHVTVRYGLSGNNCGPVRQKVEEFGTVLATFGKVDYFPSDEYDVVVLTVDSDDLHRLNGLLGELPNVQTHPEYTPHVTLAYVKPGMGEVYTDMPQQWDDQWLEFEQLVFSPKSGAPTIVDIASYPAQEAGNLKRIGKSWEPGTRVSANGKKGRVLELLARGRDWLAVIQWDDGAQSEESVSELQEVGGRRTALHKELSNDLVRLYEAAGKMSSVAAYDALVAELTRVMAAAGNKDLRAAWEAMGYAGSTSAQKVRQLILDRAENKMRNAVWGKSKKSPIKSVLPVQKRFKTNGHVTRSKSDEQLLEEARVRLDKALAAEVSK